MPHPASTALGWEEGGLTRLIVKAWLRPDAVFPLHENVR